MSLSPARKQNLGKVSHYHVSIGPSSINPRGITVCTAQVQRTPRGVRRHSTGLSKNIGMMTAAGGGMKKKKKKEKNKVMVERKKTHSSLSGFGFGFGITNWTRKYDTCACR